MPKQNLGTGNKRAVLQRPGTSYTAPGAIKLRQRRSAALDYRLQGHSYHRIAKAMNCHPSTAHDYVVRAMKEIIPREKAEAVLEMELERLNTMQAGIYSSAVAGDVSKIECCLRIIHQRARLLGLYPEKPRSGVTMSFGGDPAGNAEDTGVQVTFVRATKWRHVEGSEPVSKGELLGGPVIDHAAFNGPKG